MDDASLWDALRYAIVDGAYGRFSKIILAHGLPERSLLLAVEAASRGLPRFLKLLAQAGAQVDMLGSYGFAPIHVAADLEDISCLEVLVEAGACLDIESSEGLTPLAIAVAAKNAKAVEALSKGGADLAKSFKMHFSNQPLNAVQFAAMQEALECMALLVEQGAPFDKAFIQGESLLFYAVGSNKRGRLLRALVGKGADIEKPDSLMRTPAAKAACCGALDALELLLAAGADPNGRGRAGMSALMEAAGRGFLEGIGLLHGAGADLDALDANGLAALHFAAYRGFDDACELLLKLGADPAPPGEEISAARMARKGGHHVTASMLDSHVEKKALSAAAGLGGGRPCGKAPRL